MEKHPYFNLWLHDAVELAAVLGSPVMERTTLHEWPLSCVQRVRCADGHSLIYKVQSQPTVEPAFYARARSPLLVGARLLEVQAGAGQPPALLLEDLQVPSLEDLHLDAEAALRIVDSLVPEIQRIQGDLPALADICTRERWLAYAGSILADVRALVEAGTFQQVTLETIAQIEALSRSEALLAAIGGPCGLVHTDLSAENILVVEGGYKVIDWQRPIWGPVALDRAALLESLDLDPRAHLPTGVVQLRILLLIAWLAQCARRWFPEGAERYDQQIVHFVEQICV